jgi:hypothetical protein
MDFTMRKFSFAFGVAAQIARKPEQTHFSRPFGPLFSPHSTVWLLVSRRLSLALQIT